MAEEEEEEEGFVEVVEEEPGRAEEPEGPLARPRPIPRPRAAEEAAVVEGLVKRDPRPGEEAVVDPGFWRPDDLGG